MPRSFGTIKCSKILDVLDRAGWGEDKLRRVRLLVAGTSLKVRIKTVYILQNLLLGSAARKAGTSPQYRSPATWQRPCHHSEYVGTFYKAKPAYLNTK